MDQDEATKNVSFQSDKTRRGILLSYWIVVLMAIPLWWTTTSITRLPLPEGRVRSLKSKQLKYELRASLDEDLPKPIAQSAKESLRARIYELGLNDILSVDILSGTPDEQLAYAVVIDTEEVETRIVGRKLVVGTESIPSGKSLTFQIAKHNISNTISIVLEKLWLSSFGANQQTVQYSPRYRLAFSLMNEDAAAGDCPLSWDVKPAIARQIQPVLRRLSTLHNFTIESQVQFFAPLAFEPVQLDDGSFGLTQEQLSVFVNSAEWTLSSSVSNDPVLHFVIFVPSANRRPLRILDDEGSPTKSNAFIIPQWGSIFIHNPSSPHSESHLSPRGLYAAFSVFREQLLALLGVAPLPPGVKSSDTVSDWQLDALLRRRAYENAEGSKDTLASIVSLVHQIEGMPVGKDVTEDVGDALDALDLMYSVVRDSPQLALQYSAKALTRASRAFFNPGMLALLYFPPEHNLAVYTPLLAPVAVPLLAAAMREAIRWRRSR